MLAKFERVYKEVVDLLIELLEYKGDFVRPLQSRPACAFAQRKMPEIKRDKFEHGKILSKPDFVTAAIQRISPFIAEESIASKSIDPDLTAAINAVHTRGTNIIAERSERNARIRAIASILEPMRKTANSLKCEAAKAVSIETNVPFLAAIIDAMKWPDTALPLKYMLGFEIIFDVPDSGIFKADEQPAEISKIEFERNNVRACTSIARGIEKLGESTDPKQIEARKQCWAKTKEEFGNGNMSGPFSKAQIDRHYGRGNWRCIGRTAIEQKGKWRCIDNAKRSKHNKAASLHERLTTGRADFPAMIAREFAKRSTEPEKTQMRHGTDDWPDAYRHVPTCQMQYSVVTFWNEDESEIQYGLLFGHNFGLASAVLNYNRSPELFVAIARRLLWCVCEHFYDDVDTAEPAYAGTSGQQALDFICSEIIGKPFAAKKHVQADTCNEYLGVETDFSSLEKGIISMDVSKKRRAKLKELTENILISNSLPSGMAASLFGKARFSISPCFGCVGKACLQPIMAREYEHGKSSELTTDLRDSVEFIKFIADHMPPTDLPILPSVNERVIIFTDASASGKRSKSRSHLGVAVYHPNLGKAYMSLPVPQSMQNMFLRLRECKTYIYQWEILAAIVAFTSLPSEWLRGYPAEIWIDNAGAVGSLIKGYSGKPDCARLINMFHFAVAVSGVTSLWIDYVPTESNPADIPSRPEELAAMSDAEVLELLGVQLPAAVPEVMSKDGKWLSYVQIARSIWR